MPQRIVIDNPSTVYIRFLGPSPGLFRVYDDTGEVHYFRYLGQNTPRIKFRMPIYGTYSTNDEVEITAIVPIEIPEFVLKPILPPAERDRWKQVYYKYNKSLGTVARIDTNTGIIEHGPRYKELIRPMQIFIDEHEKAHLFYFTEEYCDYMALINYVRMGWNESLAYYSLANVLHKSEQQMNRAHELYKAIVNKIQPNFNVVQ